MEFEWDAPKDKTNQSKHSISFVEVVSVFLDAFRIERHDGREDHGEDRWLTVGLVNGFELVVIYTMRGESIRIISARKADSYERRAYWKNR